MADLQTAPPLDRTVDPGPSSDAASTPRSTPPRRPRQPPVYQIYKQPAPLRVFPLPTFAATGNPVALVHLAVAWLRQVFFPPAPEPSITHAAFWDPETRSIVVTDDKSMVDLWRQGFYGKGSLSRSEPNWLKREKVRRGDARDKVSEVATEKRREERARAKWERARAEQEAIEQRRLEEARTLAKAALEAVPAPPTLAPLPPVGPLQLLALPNSHADLLRASHSRARTSEDSTDGTDASADDGSGSSGNDDADTNTTISSDSTRLKRGKSVRFSPKVESTVFQLGDPPTPTRSVSSCWLKNEPITGPNVVTSEETQPRSNITGESQSTAAESKEPVDLVMVNKEHLQLAPEEAFFLTFAMGALKVTDSSTQGVLSTQSLLMLLRQNSYFPPRLSRHLQPDDPFLLQYAVYHHFRSLGWIPRPGVKFGVDCKFCKTFHPGVRRSCEYCFAPGTVPAPATGPLVADSGGIGLLYNRGPVFDHAEFGILVLPSYSDPYWKADGRQPPRRSWHWLMGVNRVLSKVFKSLVVVYVDVPPSTAFDEDGASRTGMADLLKQYKIQEIMVKRWSSNRNR